MGCGAGAIKMGVPVTPKEYGRTDYPLAEKSIVPFGPIDLLGQTAGQNEPRLGWYNLKVDQMVTTKPTAFPYGFDEWASNPRAMKNGEDDESKAMDEFTVGAVIADGNGKRYVNVLELTAVRIDGCVYVIKGRIERSTWREESDSWVNILMVQHEGMPARQKIWLETQKKHWSAEPVEKDVAEAHPKPEKPPQTFEDWKTAFMETFWEAANDEKEGAQKSREANAAQRAAAKSSGTHQISTKGMSPEVILKIENGQFKPQKTRAEGGGDVLNSKWHKDGDKLYEYGTSRAAFQISTTKLIRHRDDKNVNIHGWRIVDDGLKKNGTGNNEKIVLKGNEIEMTDVSGGVRARVGSRLDNLTISGDAMDGETLAFAMVALGVIVKETED